MPKQHFYETPKLLNFCLPVLSVLRARGTTRWYVPAAWGASSWQLESLRFSDPSICTFLGRSGRNFDVVRRNADFVRPLPPRLCVR